MKDKILFGLASILALSVFGIFIKSAFGLETSISVVTPNMATPWSGTVNLTLTVNNKPAGDPNSVNYIVIDGHLFGNDTIVNGQLAGTAPFYTPGNTATFPFDTRKLANGTHTFYARIIKEGGTVNYGVYGPVTFTTDNGHIPLALRANYNELWMTKNESVQLTSKVVYTDKTISLNASSTVVAYSSASPTVASVDSLGNVKALTLGDTVITVTSNGLSNFVNVHVNPDKNTPHFGKDGSILTSYDPAKSMFVRDMFLSNSGLMSSDTQYISDFHNAGINTFESGFYIPPKSNYASASAWQTSFNNLNNKLTTFLANNSFSVILTGDDIARGSDAVYDASRGPSATWNPNPLAYAFTWAKNTGKVVGVEMVDEITSAFNEPKPEGRLGMPEGPTQISCVSDVCTVPWVNPANNGAKKFLIRGATSDPDLNRPATNLYTMTNLTGTGFKFTATNVGTATFTKDTDPDLVMEIQAAVPFGPNNADYIHNDSFQFIRDQINSVSGHAPLSWPAAASAPPYYVGKWEGDPAFSDYGDMYWTIGQTSYADGTGLGDNLMAYRKYFDSRYPVLQKTKPVLWEGAGTGPMYRITGVPVNVSSIDNNVITFSEPHGISSTDTLPRFTVSGNSNSALNGYYFIYSVVNPTTVKAYVGKSNLTSGQNQYGTGGTGLFEDGGSFPVANVGFTTYNTNGIQFSQSNCPGANGVGKIVTVSGNTYAPFNIGWYLKTYDPNTCGYAIAPAVVGNGTGGTAKIVADSYYHPGQSYLVGAGSLPNIVSTSIAYAAEKGFAGVRQYFFATDLNKNAAIYNYFDGEPANSGIQTGSNPRFNGPDSIARWNAMSNAFNLIGQIEPLLLQPKLNSPDYGYHMVSTARASANGTMLMITNFREAPVTETIDLTEYNPFGTAGTMYRMTETSLSNNPVTGTSTVVTFSPSETIVFTFPPFPVPTITSFKANPTSIRTGSPVTLSWTVSGASSIKIDGGVGDVTNNSAHSIVVNPTKGMIYTLTATNVTGSKTARANVAIRNLTTDQTANESMVSPNGSVTAPDGNAQNEGDTSSGTGDTGNANTGTGGTNTKKTIPKIQYQSN